MPTKVTFRIGIVLVAEKVAARLGEVIPNRGMRPKRRLDKGGLRGHEKVLQSHVERSRVATTVLVSVTGERGVLAVPENLPVTAILAPRAGRPSSAMSICTCRALKGTSGILRVHVLPALRATICSTGPGSISPAVTPNEGCVADVVTLGCLAIGVPTKNETAEKKAVFVVKG